MESDWTRWERFWLTCTGIPGFGLAWYAYVTLRIRHWRGKCDLDCPYCYEDDMLVGQEKDHGPDKRWPTDPPDPNEHPRP